ncbi:MAG: glycoside hydrolase family 65 protein [Fibrobacter sp.]|nr:glycoside hydrolase family 65 protein [Fibrobacter sp.]
MPNNTFVVTYNDYNPQQEMLREALCTLGNGYFATRGAHESSKAGDAHYPGTYLAGGYNRLESNIDGHIIENEDLVNWPNWLYLTFKIGDDDWFSIEHVEILEYHQDLDMQHGTLNCEFRFKDNKNRETKIESIRLVSMASPHLAAIQWILTPVNWSGEITVHSAIDGNVTNSGVARYRALNGNHLLPLRSGLSSEETVYLEVCTRQSNIHMTQAIKTMAYHQNIPLPVQRKTIQESGYIAQELSFTCEEDHPVIIEKITSIYTSKDVAISEPTLEACLNVLRVDYFSTILQSHHVAWKALWERFDIQIKNEETNQRILHLHIFHILQTASPHTFDLDVGIPPRGLHGEAYRGHILWDELFVFPFLNLRNPLLSRELLLYRYRRLEQARIAAENAGYRGAMFPWQSGSNGREESQRIHLNPISKRWVPDHTCLQRHVNAAIVYSIWQYFQTTDDKEFLYYFGAEIIFEIAKFWASIARFNPERDRFEIHGVIGPDEYHTSYPNAPEPGINNNAYTNIMAAWVLMRALDVIHTLDASRKEDLFSKLHIDSEEIDRWNQISRKIYVPFNDGIIEQFDGYNHLKELDWKKYREKYGEIMRLDRILESENDSVNNYKAGKQADVLMLFYLFSAEEFTETMQQLGYDFDTSLIPTNIQYYSDRSSHGSTLSHLVSSWVLARSQREQSWNIYEKALIVDVSDIQGCTTPEGIHLGAMAGTVDMIQRCYTGLEVKDDELRFNPHLPVKLSEIRQRLRYRSHWIDVTITHDTISISFEKGWGNTVKVRIRDTVYTFSEATTQTIRI